ncbi:Eukaryotic translation initiation factor 6-2 [Platanthera guangdongensis]|uniref:Eukaryotic translation initiation factor 6-2 n=1 Tax=Platanthera guangdongensis TaxID=2320717 RepID=A0ABR2MJ50_9ASPA
MTYRATGRDALSLIINTICVKVLKTGSDRSVQLVGPPTCFPDCPVKFLKPGSPKTGPKPVNWAVGPVNRKPGRFLDNWTKKKYDPLDYTIIDSMDFWVVEEEPTPELNYNELENDIYQEYAIPIDAWTAPFDFADVHINLSSKVFMNLTYYKVVVQRIEVGLLDLGSCISCNDYIALMHPNLERGTEELITDVLGVDVFRRTVNGEGYVSDFCVFNNKGGMVPRHTSTVELNGLSALLGVPLVSGTVNNRRRTISMGLIVNDWTAFCGSATTTTELLVIERVFKLRKAQPSMFVSQMRKLLIDCYMIGKPYYALSPAAIQLLWRLNSSCCNSICSAIQPPSDPFSEVSADSQKCGANISAEHKPPTSHFCCSWPRWTVELFSCYILASFGGTFIICPSGKKWISMFGGISTTNA